MGELGGTNGSGEGLVANSPKQARSGSFGLTEADFTKEGNVVQIGYPPLRIDLLTAIDGVTFQEAFPNRKLVGIDGLEVNFIGYQELLKNKKASGRLRDLDDLENLI